MSSLNKLIANVQRTSTDLQITNFYQDQRLVAIDSSNNRIGINQLHPKYAIDISYRPLLDISDMTINTPYLIVNQHADFTQDMSCNIVDINKLIVKDLEATEIGLKDINLDNITSISGNISFIESTRTKTIDLDCSNASFTNNLTIPLSATFDCSGQFNANNIMLVSGGTFICDESANFTVCGELFYNTLTQLQGPDGNFAPSSIQHMDISKLDVSFLTVRTELSANIITSNQLNTNSLRFSGDLIVSTLKVNTEIISNDDSSFNILGVYEINANTANITNSLKCQNTATIPILIIQNKLDCKNTIQGIILPNKLDEDIMSQYKESNQLYFDNSIDAFKVYSNITDKYETCLTRQRWCKLKLNDISGNKISSTGNPNIIQDISNLLINDNLEYYRLVPFSIDLSSNYQVFSINTSNNIINISGDNVSYLKISDSGRVYHIDANICIQFLNKFPGDVEVTHYEFIIYPDFDNSDSIDPSKFKSIKNQIFSIDTSFNYASSTINLIERLDIYTKINFLIKSNSLDNLKQLRVDSFNCSIRCIE